MGLGVLNRIRGRKVDPELGYRDYPVPRIASDNYGYYAFTIEAGDKDARSPEDQETPLGLSYSYTESTHIAKGDAIPSTSGGSLANRSVPRYSACFAEAIDTRLFS